ncbi:MAG: aspartyl protease family protein [Myxococcota bacterium]
MAPLAQRLGLLAALAALGVGAAARAEQGVLADLPFLDQVPGWGSIGDGHIGIDLSPNPERPFPMLLDTGAAFSAMTPRYARKLHVTVRRLKSDPYRRKTVLGRDLQFVVMTGSSDTGSRTGVIAGLVGGNFLEEYVIEVDYAGRRVRFLDPDVYRVSQASAEPGEIVVPMRLTDRRPMIEIRLGSGSAWFLMDTGAPTDLNVSEERARTLAIQVSPDAQTVRGLNLYGTDRSALVALERARVGDFDLQDVSLEVALRKGSSYRITNVAGPDQALLGNAFLRRFRVRFDYPHRRVGLLPRAAAPAEPEPASPGERKAE